MIAMNKQPVTVHLPDDEAEALRQAAESSGRSISAEARSRLQPGAETSATAVEVARQRLEAAEAVRIEGRYAGVPIAVDERMPVNLGAGTDASRLVVLRRSDTILFLGDTARLQVDQHGGPTLEADLIAYVDAVLASGLRPNAVAVVAGTGLAAELS